MQYMWQGRNSLCVSDCYTAPKMKSLIIEQIALRPSNSKVCKKWHKGRKQVLPNSAFLLGM